jgi:tRNA 2-selenouridine synthase
MIGSLSDVRPRTLATFDDIIDVRTPAEFAEDHVPGAFNLPVLSNEERAEVGTIYVQDSRLRARRIGAAYVARNIARHLEEALSGKIGSYAPLIYCWRGGQRSTAMATVLAQVGWRPTVIGGGYKTYRRRVTAALYDAEPQFRLVLVDGYTGSAKTDILHRLGELGAQIIDLEGLAGHRGSLFGGFAASPQPGQKLFESRLLGALEALDPARPIVVEAESSKVGELNLPPTLWKAMLAAPRIEVRASRPERARYLTDAYRDIIADPSALEAILTRLPSHHGSKRRNEWRDLARSGAFKALAQSLIEHHYDPAYERSDHGGGRRNLGIVEMDDLAPAGRQRTAERILQLLARDPEPPGSRTT